MNETDPRKLFLMYQSLREVLAKETGQDAGFTYTAPDGSIEKAKDLEDARVKIRGKLAQR